MKTMIAFLLALVALNVQAAQEPVKPAAKPMVPAQPLCADPAADIQVHLLNTTSPGKGRVRISGVLTNIGQTPWIATSYTHRLRAVLSIKLSEATPHGTPVASRNVAPLAVGQQERLDYEMDWEVKPNARYPKFVMRLDETGQAQYDKHPLYKPDCRNDNNVKQITAAELNALFGNVSAPMQTGQPKTADPAIPPSTAPSSPAMSPLPLVPKVKP